MTDPQRNIEGSSAEPGLRILDKLIVKYGNVLVNKADTDAKLGDFVKMIELRRKLTPENMEKQELWDLLKNIRSESMDDHPVTTPKVSDDEVDKGDGKS